ncbi:phosphogluconate dehydratase [Alisedimentitalea sp. MJ-SS2]|uniref:phosphogluconate dehydratase n=1 Tax=Aliisedimentitalea sp. MJ-SS2 TaxID=3049795 RepID=UPI00290B7D5B|nr:phosphogluconate dehydratase [Alisedimentitalea sp. MJ-SS2]MDU8926473.1 phosphogluconate dehydratase [Alisedimentitalea sp. MJ-SS2]
MAVNKTVLEVTDRIVARSRPGRETYLAAMRRAAEDGPARAHLTCSNQAHAYAAMGGDQDRLATTRAPNLGIITAYNDMLSAHAPFESYPARIKDIARRMGATAQVAGGVPAMCDGVTQGQDGMELSLFSRDVIALAASVALSHNTFDAVAMLGTCDKIVPGLVMAAGAFAHLPMIFLPSGPMTSGLPNDEKAKVRKAFAAGETDRAALMQAEMAAYHGPGTCTFYGTANSNQMLMEIMGLHLPGASFVSPDTPLRHALTDAGTETILTQTALGDSYRPLYEIMDERAFVNGIVGLMATGGSTNLVLHLPAMARAFGIILTLQDFADLSEAAPLLARVYPNGLADVNHFHAAGGLGFLIAQLLDAGLVHEDVQTVAGPGLGRYTQDPQLPLNKPLAWVPGSTSSLNDKILRPQSDPFQPTGGLKHLTGNLGQSIIKLSAVKPEHRLIEAPARVFETQDAVIDAFKAGTLDGDAAIVLRFHGPQANGMPEVHGLTPTLSVLQDRGYKIALVTDGRMSGASGRIPAAIHLSPETMAQGPLARVRDGDPIRLDAEHGSLDNLAPDFENRTPDTADLATSHTGTGRELFSLFRDNATPATQGASPLFKGET